MKLERSCGAVVYTLRSGQPLYVILQERPGGYSFPKGHMEGDETELETARREILEETGLQPAFISGFCLKDEYHLSEKPGTWKQVTYFLAEFGDETPIPRQGEIRQLLLLPCEQALGLFQHENTRRILLAAHAFITAGQPEDPAAGPMG